jgi:hypothetical protein
MRSFVGFGSPEARTWFVGLEQGGGEDLLELERRLAAWSSLGAGAFADLPEYCQRMGESRWHGDSPRIQPTLGKLVRIALASEGIEATPDVVRRYQASRFACANGQTVIAELMPLPSRNVSEWIYSATGLPALASRDSYVREYRPLRIRLLREAVRMLAPRRVVFLGVSEFDTWAEVAAAKFDQGPGGAFWGASGPTGFVIARHPTSFGATNAYFDTIGRALAA